MRRALAIAVVITWSASGRAGAPTSGDDTAAAIALGQRDAEAARQAGDATTGDDARAAYARCGESYLALANAFPTWPARDELLYNAATCLAHAGAIGAALMVGDELVQQYPRSQLAAMAILQGARVRYAIGQIDEAAAAWDRYADRYAAERDAVDALANVVRLRATTGDLDGARDAATRFATRYGARRPDDAARLLGLVAHELAERGDHDGAIALFETAGRDRRIDRALRAELVMAHAELRWARSCPGAVVGLCLDGGAPAQARRRVARDRDAAMAVWPQLESLVDPTDPRGAALIARARLHQAEAAIEAAVALGPVPETPTDARGAVTPAGMKALATWLNAWQVGAAAADRAVARVLELPVPGPAIAAAAATTMLYAQLALTLRAAPVPRPLRGGPGEAIYREALAAPAAALEARATEAARACVERAAALGVVDEAVAACVNHLARSDRALALDERVPAPAEVAPGPALEP